MERSHGDKMIERLVKWAEDRKIKLMVAILVFRFVIFCVCMATAIHWFGANDDIRGMLWLILGMVIGLGG